MKDYKHTIREVIFCIIFSALGAVIGICIAKITPDDTNCRSTECLIQQAEIEAEGGAR